MYSECRHIMPSGSKCHSPALRGQPYCYYHVKLHRCSDSPTINAMTVFYIEDTRGIQLALTHVLTALNSPYMDTRRAGLMLYGLQIAAQLVRQTPSDKPDETVRVCEETNGISLAPPKEVCEPATDCPTCPHRQSCPDCKEPREREKEERLEEKPEEADTAEEQRVKEKPEGVKRLEEETEEAKRVKGKREEEKAEWETEEEKEPGENEEKREPAAPFPDQMCEQLHRSEGSATGLRNNGTVRGTHEVGRGPSPERRSPLIRNCHDASIAVGI